MSLRNDRLAALDLGPFWIRRSVLADMAQAEQDAQAARVENHAPALAADRVASETPTPAPGHHTPSPVSRTAQKLLEQVTRVRRPQQDDTPAHTGADNETSKDERSLRIARLDWQELQEEVRGCSACGLCQQRQQAVFGVGNKRPRIAIVGEAPGAEEDRLGEPFVGAAGQLLDNMLRAIGHSRGDQVYIANVLKCRPPGNRNPAPEEVARCTPFLDRQLALLQPQVIFAVGRFAISHLLRTDAPVSALRGRVHQWQGIPLVVSYHPAYLLRNLPDKSKAWSDLLLLQDTLQQQLAKGMQAPAQIV
ncbi:uracil-DNA glycosylase [Chitinilyticum piscinae]|uniref:Type-4 uracil-DNA glycosylase n=1 Tax=Chitinilyticum piscinae TaxID=2866724 RepID=A0A8J7FKH2_9NEIS|nr:uracil-DNA glycosylase [Chitinilyticum piscinae]MBE9609662.1 uracil-DNA glycosylase [Chitinilyticum piscinae]